VAWCLRHTSYSCKLKTPLKEEASRNHQFATPAKSLDICFSKAKACALSIPVVAALFSVGNSECCLDGAQSTSHVISITTRSYLLCLLSNGVCASQSLSPCGKKQPRKTVRPARTSIPEQNYGSHMLRVVAIYSLDFGWRIRPSSAAVFIVHWIGVAATPEDVAAATKEMMNAIFNQMSANDSVVLNSTSRHFSPDVAHATGSANSKTRTSTATHTPKAGAVSDEPNDSPRTEAAGMGLADLAQVR
jgi:hypothetical protein